MIYKVLRRLDGEDIDSPLTEFTFEWLGPFFRPVLHHNNIAPE